MACKVCINKIPYKFPELQYFKFQASYYEQTDGAAMGSPESPVVANIYLEMFEELALRMATHPPRIWRYYVEDTFCVITKTEVEGSWATSTAYVFHCGARSGWQVTVPRHTPPPQEQWIPWHKHLQKAHPHRPCLNFSSHHPRHGCCVLPLLLSANHPPSREYTGYKLKRTSWPARVKKVGNCRTLARSDRHCPVAKRAHSFNVSPSFGV